MGRCGAIGTSTSTSLSECMCVSVCRHMKDEDRRIGWHPESSQPIVEK